MRFFKKLILSFCMVTVLLGSMPLCVFASDLNDGENDGYDRFMGGHNIKGFNTWESTDKKSFTLANIGSFFASIGMYFKGMSNESLMDILIEHLIESGRIADAESIDEYIASHLTANEEETELYLSNDFTNALYETSVQYIEENTGYWVYPTADINDYIVYKSSIFQTNEMVSIVKDFISSCSSTTVFYSLGTYTYKDAEDLTQIGIQLCLFDYNDVNFVTSSLCSGSTNDTPYVTSKNMNCWRYDSNWESTTISRQIQIDLDGNITESELSSTLKIYPVGQKQHYYKAPGSHYYYYYHWWYDNPLSQPPFVATPVDTGFFTSGRTQLRMYKSLDDLKQYSLGSRPYYMTSDFYNYNSSIDNSTTITQTEIDNSITYGDVYNYIINNYDNPDGLTEEELRAILEEYLSQIGGGSGSGSGSGDDDDDDGGGGLLDFLSGLGSLGDAILSIVGKLIEYVGKAIDLIVNGISGIIEKIPQSITGLMTAAFPFLPEEFFTAIELALILGVVCIVIKIFK